MNTQFLEPSAPFQPGAYASLPPLQYLLNHPLCALTPELHQRTGALVEIMQYSGTQDPRQFLAAAHQFAALITTYSFLHTGLLFAPKEDARSTLDSLCAMLPEYDPIALADAPLSDLLERIRFHYVRPPEFREAARSTHFSSSYFSMLFKKTTGLCFTDYITATRLQNACQMLSTSMLSIQEISDRCGFSDISYFSRCFKRKLGISPLQWRRRQ